jgi:2,4-dienoyl-CoA reductase-like NADH-dependent reductase (Old Yellow Enzyme family)/thioredoxin reductase
MAGLSRFEKLLEPIQIGKMTLRNRIVMPAMNTNFGSEEGYVTQRTKDYYEERAKGGVGLVTVEAACVDYPIGKITGRQLAIDNDKFLPGLSELAQCIHRHGAKASSQLHHGGPRADYAVTHIQPVSASPIAVLRGVVPTELTPGDIAKIIARYGEAAERAKRAGFDAVEIQFGGGYLLAAFLSRVTNKRQDNYGGELKNRARIHLEILKTVKEAVGQSYPVLCRMNSKEYGEEYGLDGCLTVKEAQQFARMVEDGGANAISVHVCGFTQVRGSLAVDVFKAHPDERGAMLPSAHEIKKVVSVPVITVGRFDPELANKVLQENKADLVAFGRGLLADPQLPNKIISGTVEDIAPCILCHTCLDSLYRDQPVRCSVNAALGRELDYQIRRAEKKKKVVIIGGGPAGMEAARVTALRGYEVVLYEKGYELGGQLLVASLPPEKDRISALTRYLVTQVIKLGVKLELGKEANSTIIEEAKPDVVIIATGTCPIIPEIPGIQRDNVAIAEDVLLGKKEVKEKVVIIGGGIVGCEVAEFLVDKGKKVIVVEMLPRMALKMPFTRREQLLTRLKEKGTTLLSNVKCEGFMEKGNLIITKEGKETTLEVDTIILAAGAKPKRQLFEVLKSKFTEIHLAGDCAEPRDILAAIDDASRIARLI